MTNKRQLLKVRSKGPGEPVAITWRIESESGEYDVYAMESKDAALPSFYTALQGLAPSVATLCEIPHDSEHPIKVVNLTLTYDEDNEMGACITGLRTLLSSNSPLVLNTPHRQAVPCNDEGPALDNATLDRIAVAISAAWDYLDGERAQAELPLGAVGVPA